MRTALQAVRDLGVRLDDAAHDDDGLAALAQDRQFVLLGEATHGTAEFYRMRARITLRLIAEHGFDAVAVEGDWPDAWAVHRCVTLQSGPDPVQALAGFERFPVWMWRNREVAALVRALRAHNAPLPPERRAGFYGLDLYSLYRSADDVVRYLRGVDPEAAEAARHRYEALDHVRDAQSYGYQAAMRMRPSAQAAVRRQLDELRQAGAGYQRADSVRALDAQFAAERNAAAVVNAETYYRAMFSARDETWNLRDAHMRDTLFALSAHRRRLGGSGRVVVWAHNSHLGDARATEMGARGEWNLGQLVRQAAGERALLVGFTTYAGTVSAAADWDGEVERMRVRPALADSWERLFHESRLDRFFLPLHGAAAAPLRATRLERAIGVIYRPQTERASHYFGAALGQQFDAVFHLDETSALEPLQAPAHWHAAEAPETLPSGR